MTNEVEERRGAERGAAVGAEAIEQRAQLRRRRHLRHDDVGDALVVADGGECAQQCRLHLALRALGQQCIE